MARGRGPAPRYDPHPDPTLDLHGVRVADALTQAQRFLAQEHAKGTVSVRIVTGHGSGAVKTAVRDLLNGHPAVLSWSPAVITDAITIVVLTAR
jgi:DNA mismatch repair protein MutS2